MKIKPALPKILKATAKVESPWRGVPDALPQIKPALPDIAGLFGFSHAYFNLIKYYGGKYFQLGNTLPYIEMVAKENEAHTYIECFGGGGKCILNLDTINHHFDRAIYNEWDKGLCNLFEVTANPELAEQMAEQLSAMDYSKETFDNCKTHRLDESNSLLESAYMTFLACQMSFNGDMGNFDSIKYTQNVNTATFLYNMKERIRNTPEHLLGVEVSNCDYKELMKDYGDNPHVVKYLDPPYHPLCRGKSATKVYPNELPQEQHKELVEILCKSRSWVMSGYDPAQYGCDDYVALEDNGAIKESIGLYHVSSSRSDKSKEEFIWYKF